MIMEMHQENYYTGIFIIIFTFWFDFKQYSITFYLDSIIEHKCKTTVNYITLRPYKKTKF